jgi:U3 small nucleolar RNA-associated protein 10
MTSLAAQLAQNASLNSSLLVDRSRRKPRESYLFTGRDDHDLDSLHALSLNGLAQLSMLDPIFRPFEDDIFSDQARAIDRTLLSAEANAQLDKTIGNFLSLLGPYVLESPANKVLEWLVRRLRYVHFLSS